MFLSIVKTPAYTSIHICRSSLWTLARLYSSFLAFLLVFLLVFYVTLMMKANLTGIDEHRLSFCHRDTGKLFSAIFGHKQL